MKELEKLIPNIGDVYYIADGFIELVEIDPTEYVTTCIKRVLRFHFYNLEVNMEMFNTKKYFHLLSICIYAVGKNCCNPFNIPEGDLYIQILDENHLKKICEKAIDSLNLKI